MEEKRDSQESVRGIHLLILFSYTIFCIILIIEDLFLNWERWALPLLLFALFFCWGLHLTQRYSPHIRVRFYAICEMMTFFFYGIHETSFYDLAPVIIVILLIYTATEETGLILNFVEVYYLTIIYDLLFNPADRPAMTILSVTRFFLHVLLVLLGGWVSFSFIHMRRGKDALFRNRIRQLEDTNQRTEDFLTNVSHELRTPINVVIGISSVMLKKENDGEKHQQLRSIRDAGHRLFEQIDDILDHTELHSGRLQLQNENYMISSLIGDLHSESAFLQPTKDLALIFDIDPSVPAVLYGDSRKIKKILRHLIDNALKFTQTGGAYVCVRSVKREYGVNLQITVSDTGTGISEKDIDRVTEQFFQGNSGRSRSTGGLGLGLPIVSGLISAIGGFLQIKSKEGEGSTIKLSIPQKVVDPSPCMTIDNASGLHIASYNRPDIYEGSRVLDFYTAATTSLAGSLQVDLHSVTKLRRLKLLTRQIALTHVFVGMPEYREDPAFFASLSEQTSVFLLKDAKDLTPLPERIHVIPMPYSSFSIVNALNRNPDTEENGSSSAFGSGQMVCPGIRILVVDDEIMNLVVAKGIFRNYQLIVETAQSGHEALEICRRQDFDLVFLDHMMPEMDGVELMKRMRSEYPDRKWSIITLTANAVSSAREMFFREGFDEFLSKPLEQLEFERVLRKFLPQDTIRYIETETPETPLPAEPAAGTATDAETPEAPLTVELAAGTATDTETPETPLPADPAARTATDAGTPEEPLPVEPAAETDPVLSSLEAIGFDPAAGLASCINNRDFYLSVIGEFINEAPSLTDELVRFRQDGRGADLHARILSVRDIARLIGAPALEKAALEENEALPGILSDTVEKAADVCRRKDG